MPTIHKGGGTNTEDGSGETLIDIAVAKHGTSLYFQVHASQTKKKKTRYVKIKMVTVASVPNHAKERAYGSTHAYARPTKGEPITMEGVMTRS